MKLIILSKTIMSENFNYLDDGLSWAEFKTHKSDLKNIQTPEMSESAKNMNNSQVQWLIEHFDNDPEELKNHLKEWGPDTAIYQMYAKVNWFYNGKIDGIWWDISELAFPEVEKIILKEKESEASKWDPSEKEKREKEPKKYRTVREFVRENPSYRDTLEKDVDVEMVIYDDKNDVVSIWTEDWELLLENKKYLVVKFSNAPNDKPARIDISKELPLDREKVTQLTELVRAFWRLSQAREYVYSKKWGSHYFTFDDGYITIWKYGEVFEYSMYNNNDELLHQKDLPNSNTVRYEMETLPNGKIVRREFDTETDKQLFEDEYKVEKDPKRNDYLYKTDGKPKIILADGSTLKLFNSHDFSTEDAYLDYLAKKLTSPYLLSKFFSEMMRYVFDSDNIFDIEEEWVKRYKEWIDEVWDVYHKPTDLVRRTTTRGYMCWDCDDYAGLAHDILKRQNKDVHQVLIPWHAITVCIDKTPSWKYVVYSIWTFWLDINWIRDPFSKGDSWEDYTVDNIEEWLKNIQKKYKGLYLKYPNVLEDPNYSRMKDGKWLYVIESSENRRDFIRWTWQVDRETKYISYEENPSSNEEESIVRKYFKKARNLIWV